MVIRDCGEIKAGDDWNYCDHDESLENLPPFPTDWIIPNNDELKVKSVIRINNFGNNNEIDFDCVRFAKRKKSSIVSEKPATFFSIEINWLSHVASTRKLFATIITSLTKLLVASRMPMPLS